jgi:hypothetical protein
VSAGLVPELGISYKNGGLVALGVNGGVVVVIDGDGPLCDVVAVETVVAWTNNGKLGDVSPMVETMMGIEEFPEEVIAFVAIAM